MWLVLSSCELVKETGDFDFLKRVIPFADGEEGVIYEHMKRAMDYLMADIGPYGLPYIHYADWNDALNIDDDEAESVFMAMGLAWAQKEMASLCEKIGDTDYAKILNINRLNLIDRINDVAWDGDWYVRALSKYGVIGSKNSGVGGNTYINPQIWSILADVCPAERLGRVLATIDHMDQEYGIKLCEPAYPYYNSHVGRMSGMLPGLFENGGTYNHCNAFKIMSDCKLGRADQAVSTLLKLIPNSDINPSSISGAEPYLFVNCWCMHPSFFTRIWFAWLTGTSAWALRGFYEGICGLKRYYEGLRIEPCLPKEWKLIELNRKFRNCQYHIVIENNGGTTSEYFMDGISLKDNLLPIVSDGNIHEVIVRL